MLDAEPFLRAVCAAANDDVPRLVFADWLEEQGDPRAEFIRVQIEYSHLPARDPRRKPLLIRERELFASYHKLWDEILHPVPIIDRTFRRGFIEEITVSAPDLVHHAELIFTRTPVRSLKLVDVNALSGDIANIAWLAQLHTFDISGNQLADLELARLLASRHWQSLRVLDIRQNQLGNETFQVLMLPVFAGLEEIDLRQCIQLPSGRRRSSRQLDAEFEQAVFRLNRLRQRFRNRVHA
jgi:uncharacterized protein (TIGR02996 family)